MNLLSIGDIIDKLIIENIKAFELRKKLHEKASKEKSAIYKKLMIANSNRRTLVKALDEKINDVKSGKEPNVILQQFKTYD